MKISKLVGLAVAVVIGGCATGIKVTKVSSTVLTQKGNPWNLPMTQFSASITRHIVGCGSEIKGSVEVLPTPTLGIDQEQRYVLHSTGRWATSDITSTLAPSGISTGLNAQSTDTTATVISSVIGTAAKIAVGLAAGAPPPPPNPDFVPPPPQPVELCQPNIAKVVDELYPPTSSGRIPLKTQVDNATAALEEATAQVVLLAAQANADASFKPKLVIAESNQKARQDELTALQKKLTTDLALTTDVKLATWPLLASEFRTSKPYTIDRAVFAKWATPAADTAAAEAEFSVSFALYRRNPMKPGWQPAEGEMRGVGPVDVSVGVPVRLAQVGRLLTCVKKSCPMTALPEGPSLDSSQTANDLPILQLGQIYLVPVAGGRFRSESAVIALDSNGLPTSIQVTEKASTAATAAAAAKDTASQLAALPEQISAARLARTQAQTNQLTANAALATAQANGGVLGQTSALAAQTALINAQTNLSNAQTNAGFPLQTSALTAQTALMNAQAALATAQANAQNVDQVSAWGAQASLANAQAAQINAAAALAKAHATAP